MIDDNLMRDVELLSNLNSESNTALVHCMSLGG
jgi:hypothetical protein